jgi:hypothetical protein
MPAVPVVSSRHLVRREQSTDPLIALHHYYDAISRWRPDDGYGGRFSGSWVSD